MKKIISKLLTIAVIAGMLPGIPAKAAQNDLLGKFVYFGRYNNNRAVYEVVGKKDVDGNGTQEYLLLSRYAMSYKAYDPENVNWGTSAIRTWLNSSDNTVIWQGKAPSSANGISVNPYENEAGFMTGMTSDEKAMIVPVNNEGSIDNVFFLTQSEYQSYATTNPVPGQWPHATGQAGGAQLYNYRSAWTRTVTSAGDQVFYTYWSGGANFAGRNITDGKVGVRPAMYITSSVQIVSGSGANKDNPAVIEAVAGIDGYTFTRGGNAVTGVTAGNIDVAAYSNIGALTINPYIIAAQLEKTSEGDILRAAVSGELQNGAITIAAQDTLGESYISAFALDGTNPIGAGTVLGQATIPEVYTPAGSGFLVEEAVPNDKQISVKLSGTAGKRIAVWVLPETAQNTDFGKAVYINSFMGNGAGTDLKFVMPDTDLLGNPTGGIYKVYASDGNNVKTKTFGFAGENTKTEVVDFANNGNQAALEGIFANTAAYALHNTALVNAGMFDELIGNPVTPVALATEVINKKPQAGYDMQSLVNVINEKLYQEAFYAGDGDTRRQLSENSDYFSVSKMDSIVTKSYYTDLAGTPELLSAYASVPTGAPVVQTVKENILIAAVNVSPNATAIMTVVEDGADTLGIVFPSEYYELSNTDLKRLYDRLLKRGFTTANEIKQAFDEALAGLGNDTDSANGNISKPTEEDNDIKNETSINPNAFSDLEDVLWAKDDILLLTALGAVSGTDIGVFSPNEDITREAFAKMIASTFGIEIKPTGGVFSDVEEGAWYDEYIGGMYAAGIMSGYSEDKFGIGESITRQDIAVVIYNALKYKGMLLNDSYDAGFDDSEEISDYAYIAVNSLNLLKIINGMGDGNFAPKKSATRAEAAKMAAGAYHMYKGLTDTDSERTIDVDYEVKLNLLKSLGILDGEGDGILTRAELIRDIIRAMGINVDGVVLEKQLFADVPVDSVYSGYVLEAVNRGMISADNNSLGADEEVTQDFADCIFAAALGYQTKDDVSARSFINNTKIYKGVMTADNITHKNEVVMLFNLLFEDVWEMQYSEPPKLIKGDETFMEKYHDLIKGTGIITDNGITAIGVSENSRTSYGNVVINNELYKNLAQDADMLLGMEVTYYYRSEGAENEILCIDERLDINERTTIPAYSIQSAVQNGRNVTVKYAADNGRIYKAVFDASIDFVYNGKNTPFEISYFTDLMTKGQGEVTFIERDGVVLARILSNETYVVKSVDTDGIVDIFERIFRYDFENNEENYRILKDNREISLSQITPGDVVEVALSRDGSELSINVISGKVNAYVTGIREDSIAADDVTYMLSDYYVYANGRGEVYAPALKLNKAYDLYFNSYGEIIAAVGTAVTASGSEYGYLVSMKGDRGDSEAEVIIKTVNMKAEMNEYKLAEKIRINDDARIERGDIFLNTELYTDSAPKNVAVKRQMIYYEFNDAGEIKRILTAKPALAGDYSYTKENLVREDRFRVTVPETSKFYSDKKHFYSSGSESVPEFYVDDKTKILMLPDLVQSAIGWEDEHRYKQAALSDFNGGLEYKIIGYNGDKYDYIPMMLMYQRTADNTELSRKNLVVVDRVVTVLDENEEPIRQLTGFSNGKTVSYYEDSSGVFSTGGHQYERGDLVQLMPSADGKFALASKYHFNIADIGSGDYITGTDYTFAVGRLVSTDGDFVKVDINGTTKIFRGNSASAYVIWKDMEASKASETDKVPGKKVFLNVAWGIIRDMIIVD